MAEVPIASVVGIPKPDGTTEWWELTDTWRLLRTEPSSADMASDAEVAGAISTHAALPDAHHPQVHTHPNLGDVEQVNFVDALEVDGEKGLTEEIPLEKVKVLVFNKGILVKYG